MIRFKDSTRGEAEMITYKQSDLDSYLQNDWILKMLIDNMNQEEEQIRTNQWLMEMDNKRMIYADVYGDILKNELDGNLSVLDVGGGYNALTKVLSQFSDYTLVDFLAHGGNDYLERISKEYSIHWMNDDWYETEFKQCDIVIANDIFPDADMRLELFLDKMIPKCRELRVVLTYYNKPRFYQMGRRDDPEILTFLSWDGEILGMKLKKYLSRMDVTEEELDQMKNDYESIYWNGRQVCYVKLRGDL